MKSTTMTTTEKIKEKPGSSGLKYILAASVLSTGMAVHGCREVAQDMGIGVSDIIESADQAYHHHQGIRALEKANPAFSYQRISYSNLYVFEYVVKTGDSFWGIAQDFNAADTTDSFDEASIDDVVLRDGTAIESIIKPGQMVYIAIEGPSTSYFNSVDY